MDTFMTVFLSFCITGVFASFIYLNRNTSVFLERQRILNIISELSREDIRNNRNYIWRYNEFDLITYNNMFWPFWKPVRSFFKDKNCTKKFEELAKNED